METIHEYLDPIYSALNTDLSEIEEKHYGRSATDFRTVKRRPYITDITVYSFPQTWGSTALGFGGVGGAAMTTAQTVVITLDRDACVYFGGRLAYKTIVCQKLMDDIAAHNVAAVYQSTKYE